MQLRGQNRCFRWIGRVTKVTILSSLQKHFSIICSLKFKFEMTKFYSNTKIWVKLIECWKQIAIQLERQLRLVFWNLKKGKTDDRTMVTVLTGLGGFWSWLVKVWSGHGVFPVIMTGPFKHYLVISCYKRVKIFEPGPYPFLTLPGTWPGSPDSCNLYLKL